METKCRKSRLTTCTVILAACWIIMGSAEAVYSFQFRLPKIPKVPGVSKEQPKAPATSAPQVPVPEITSISPKEVPPGWSGEIVLTGRNFPKTMTLRPDCGDSAVSWKEFKVESPERAVQSIAVRLDAEDKGCQIYIAYQPSVAANSEIAPSQPGTVEVVQVKAATFGVSAASTLAVARGACLMGEGPIGGGEDPASRYEAYLNLQIEFQKKFVTNPGFLQECHMYVSPDSVKYVQSGKTVFEKPASSVAKVEKFSMPTPFGDQPTDVFSITWADGKVQNFMGMNQDSAPASMAYDDLKKKLNK